MSRTHKDVPRHVITARNLKAGRITHNHTAPTRRDFYSLWPSRELSATFYKRDQKAINEYRAYLDSLGTEVKYDVTESPGEREFPRFVNGHYISGSIGLKTVTFQVYRHVEVYDTAYCTDAEHYDLATNTDTRDGGRVKCTPDSDDPSRPGSRYRCRCSYCRGTKTRRPRGTVKNALGQLAREANSGGLDPYLSDPIFEEPNGPKTWGEWC